MHALAVVLVAAAGVAYCLAAAMRWRALGRVGDPPARGGGVALWTGFALHSAALVIACLDRSERDLFYAALGSWSAIAALLYFSRFAAGASRGLLALPVGCAALLVAVAALAVHPERQPRTGGAISWLHIGLMTGYLATVLAAGSAGMLYLLAAGQLKSASARALRLPALPSLERLTERALVASTALLMAGIATGGAVMEQQPNASLAQPTVAIALLNLAMQVTVLAVRASGRIRRRTLASAATVCMALGVVELISLMVAPHG
jgi:ABC-type uncharacterized transport system permease subunit